MPKLCTGGNSGCKNVPVIENNEAICSGMCASFGSLLWVVGLILYLSVQPILKNWQSVKLTDTFRSVLPGCRYINISSVNTAGIYQQCTKNQCNIEAQFCDQQIDLLVEYPAEYGNSKRNCDTNTEHDEAAPYAHCPKGTYFEPTMGCLVCHTFLNKTTYPSRMLPGSKNPFPNTQADDGVTKTKTFQTGIIHSFGKKQCVYASMLSWDRKEGPYMPTTYYDNGGVEVKCTLKKDDNICEQYPSPNNFNTDIFPCWSGARAKGLLADIFPSCTEEVEPKCIVLEDPSIAVTAVVSYYQQLSDNGMILIIVGGFFHFIMIALSYCYCWQNVEGRGSRAGFWPICCISSFSTLACVICVASGVARAVEKGKKKKEAAKNAANNASSAASKKKKKKKKMKKKEAEANPKSVAIVVKDDGVVEEGNVAFSTGMVPPEAPPQLQ